MYVASVTDVFARRIVGWRVSNSMRSEFVLDALDQALSIRYTERLTEAGIAPSTGKTGNAYDNALAETINGLFKTEVIRRRGSWKGVEDVEYATTEILSGKPGTVQTTLCLF